MDIASAKAEATTRTELPHTNTHKHTHKHTHPSTQPLTWQHDIKSLMHRKQVDGSTVRTSRGHRNNLLLPEGTLM